MSVTVLQLITDALNEIGVVAAAESPQPSDAQFALRKLQRLLDAWNANERYIYSLTFPTFAIPTGRTPNADKSVSFTIGPSTVTPAVDFVVIGARPVRIESANLIFTNTQPYVKSPINIRDDDWWHGQRIPGITSQVPTDLYYDVSFPAGHVYLWPVETVGYLLELEIWSALTQVTKLTDTINFPQGYEKALVLSLAEDLAGPMQSPIDVRAAAAKARAEIQGNNVAAPKLDLSAGIPASGRGLPSFNFRTGSSR